MAITVTPISTQTNYNVSDEILLNPSITQSFFDPQTNYIEYTISTPDNSFSIVDYNYVGYSFPNSGVTSNSISDIIINPEADLVKKDLNDGEFNVFYNFLKNELNSSFNNQNFFIKEISPDRTELTLNTIDDTDIVNIVNNFRNQLNSNPNYFQDFFLNFGNNTLCVANNININSDTLDIFINLYEPLPNSVQIKDTLWIVTQVANELAFNIVTTPDLVKPIVTSFPLKGPNFNLPIKDQVNNSTDFQTYSSLITSSLLSTSYSQLNNLISSSGIEVNIDYTDFSNFIHFSSAVSRINNFYYKKQLIDKYQQEIDVLNNITSLTTTGNTTLLTNQINSIIENFDGYEYFLYYGSGSWSYPKSDSTIPYTLYPAGSPQVLAWLGDADNLTGILGSASLYDKSNLDYLYNTVPNFIQEDDQNIPYQTFIDMVAQHYDNIWVYYKDVSNRYNTDNRLDYGISKDLVASALKSFGVKLYQNNFSTNDLYSAFLGYGNPNPDTTGSLPVPSASGIEYIDNYLTASYSSPMPLDDVNKEVYKRLYHNLPYLAKTKGTIPGLRALINCFGIPDTILRISEFGGRDKDTSTYDYFTNVYNYSYYRTGSNYISTSFPLNSKWNAPLNKPSGYQFRFKPSDINNLINTQHSQSLFYFRYFNFLDSSSYIVLEYTGSGFNSSSYSGSSFNPEYAYANLKFYPHAGNWDDSASIYLPFYNGEWWSVSINAQSSSTSPDTTFTLYAGGKGYYSGYDGNQVMYVKSSSITVETNTTAWGQGAGSGNVYFARANDFVNPPSTATVNGKYFKPFTGYYQELRYWIRTQSINEFEDFIMNPRSVTYRGLNNEYADYLALRNSLGAELDPIPKFVAGNSSTYLQSYHPKSSRSGSYWFTSSFNASSSPGAINFVLTASNIEPYLYNQPIVGIKNRVTDKIQIVSSSYPTGNVLSRYRSLEQDYSTLKDYRIPLSTDSEPGSEVPDINLLEIAFSPQNEINDDIIGSLGYFNIGEFIGDPRDITSRDVTYPDLVNLSTTFFNKYFSSYNLFDYIRLIKYFDNSLFKMINDFTPARTSLASGVVIKQHILERNKYPQPLADWENVTYSGSIKSQWLWSNTLSGSYLSSSLIEAFSGGTGGTFSTYNVTGSILPNNTQSWLDPTKTPVGLINISQSDQKEFYDGELPYSEIVATNGELNEDNTFKYPSTYEIYYNPVLYKGSITTETTFLNNNTDPKPGEIFLWWDSGSLTNPGKTTFITPTKMQCISYGNCDLAYFGLNKTNGVKYIKVNRYDTNGVNQSDYLGQLETITLLYQDRTSPVIYNIAGTQEFNSYYLYSIGPYTGMNNFNTSSIGDILNYDQNFSASYNISSNNVASYPAGVTYGAPFASVSPTTGSGVFADIYPDPTYGVNILGVYPIRTPNTKYTVTASFAVSNLNAQTRRVGFFIAKDYVVVDEVFQDVSGPASTALNLALDISNVFVSGAGYQFGFYCDQLGTSVTHVNDPIIYFNQSPLEFDGSSSLTIFDPYVGNFDYNDYNAIINDATENQISQFFMKVDYDQSPVIPSNLTVILENSAPKAQVQDSNYDSRAYSNIRYNGSRTNSYKIINQ